MNATVSQIQLAELQKRLGYQFVDMDYLALALTHRSASKTNNERLEFLGDSLVNHVVACFLYQRFPEATEGQLSRLRAKLVRGSYLAVIATELDLGACLTLGMGERKSGGRHRNSILADALEAVAGAVLLDAGFVRAEQVVSAWFASAFAEVTLTDERDSKTRLQEWLQGQGYPLPEYDLESVTGADHEQVFHVACHIQPLADPVRGLGSSRRQAEQVAAGKAFKELMGE